MKKIHFSVQIFCSQSSLERYDVKGLLLSGQSDENLVHASRSGDRDAYAVLAKRHYKRVFVACLGMLGRVHDAEDIAQETMLKGLLYIGDLRKPSQFGSWIVKIARNDCISLIRRRSYANKLVAQRPVPADDTLVPYQDVRQAIEKLTPDARLPLVMYYFGGENVRDVAQELNLSRSRVYQRLRAATKQLHRLLEKQGDVI